MTGTPLYITAAGAVTALGLTFRRTVASLRSGLDAFTEIPFAGAEGQDLQAAPIRGWGEGLGGVFRYAALARLAILPCLAGLSESERRLETTVFLGLPRPNRPGVPERLAEQLREALSPILGIPIPHIHAVSLGRASVLRSVKEAGNLFRSTTRHICIVGGVDCLVNGRSLAGLSDKGLLKEAWDGFIPGEAAGFIRVSPTPDTGCWRDRPAAIGGIGLASESADASAQNPLVGVGVSQAFGNAIETAGVSEDRVYLRINDVSGSRAAFEDDAYGCIRFFRSYRDHLPVWHPASHLGETGAAVGAIALIWAAAALELGVSPGSGILVSTADADLRAAAFLAMADRSTGHRTAFYFAGLSEPAWHATPPPEDPISREPDPGLRLTDVDDPIDPLIRQNGEALAWLITLRRAHHADADAPWADIAQFETQLVSHLDALIWSGEVGRRWAMATLESEEALEGAEATAAAVMCLLSSPSDPETIAQIRHAVSRSEEHRDEICAALPHLPRPGAEPVLRNLLTAPEPAIRAAALRALALGGWSVAADLLALLDTGIPELLGPIVFAAGVGGFPGLWNVLYGPLRSHIDRIDGADLFGLAAIFPRGAALPGDFERYLFEKAPTALALMDLRDNRAFLNRLSASTALSPDLLSPDLAEALGWAGEPAAHPLLLKNLAAESAPLRAAAAEGLHTLFGTDCRETVQVPLSTDTDPEAPAQMEFVSVKRLSQSPEVWAEALRRFPGQRSPGVRLRHGSPWHPESAVDHLQRSEAAYKERLIAAWEYAIVHSGPLPLHPIWFIERQRRALREIIP